jgi:hypothetical protein
MVENEGMSRDKIGQSIIISAPISSYTSHEKDNVGVTTAI